MHAHACVCTEAMSTIRSVSQNHPPPKKIRAVWKEVDFRIGAEKIQDKPGSTCVRKEGNA